MSHLKLKICGLTRIEDIREVSAMGAHYGGFIFYEKSPRFVEGKLDAAAVKAEKGLKKVGVFVNSKQDYILKQAEAYGLDLLQLHGDESPEMCASLRKKYPIIKAFRIKTTDDLKKTVAYEAVCDFFLFDTPGKLYGGNGKSFDWKVLNEYKGTVPFFLSGGIGPDDTEKIYAFQHPAFCIIDVNSSFETLPGIKNTAALKQFLWDLNIS